MFAASARKAQWFEIAIHEKIVNATINKRAVAFTSIQSPRASNSSNVFFRIDYRGNPAGRDFFRRNQRRHIRCGWCRDHFRIRYLQAYITAVAHGKTGPEVDKGLQAEVDGLWDEVERLAAAAKHPIGKERRAS